MIRCGSWWKSPTSSLVWRALIVSMAFSAASGPAYAAGRAAGIDIVATNDLAVPVGEALAFKAANPEAKILLVFDIDNTLLKMPQSLGGDAWFNDHVRRIARTRDADFENMERLLDAQNFLLEAGTMEPTQQDMASLIGKAVGSDIDIFLLSARSPGLFDATRRELARSGVHYPPLSVCAFSFCSASGRYDDGEIKAGARALGLPFEAGTYRSILVREGIMLTSGQDKGTMLALLLEGIRDRSYDRVFFIDDGRSNIDAVGRSSYSVPVKAYHYTRWNGGISAADVKKDRRDFLRIRQTVCQVMAADIC